MSVRLASHRAEYELLRPDGSLAGRERLEVRALDAGYIVSAEMDTTHPAPVTAQVQWELDAELATRLLIIHSTDGWGAEAELELTITGNGMLAHRRAPDGPTQIELGWGPQAELDYLSMAFPLVLNARRAPAGGGSEVIDSLHIGLEDLLPVVVRLEIGRRTPGPANPAGHRLECLTLDTGHRTIFDFDADGTLDCQVGHARRVAGAQPRKPAPTK